jgi:hypothetical protein
VVVWIYVFERAFALAWKEVLANGLATYGTAIREVKNCEQTTHPGLHGENVDIRLGFEDCDGMVIGVLMPVRQLIPEPCEITLLRLQPSIVEMSPPLSAYKLGRIPLPLFAPLHKLTSHPLSFSLRNSSRQTPLSLASSRQVLLTFKHARMAGRSRNLLRI